MKKFKIIPYLLISLLISACTSEKISSVDKAYEILERNRDERKASVESYLHSLLNQAKSAQSDNFLNSFFKTKKAYARLKKLNSTISPAIANKMNKIEIEVLYHHIKNYNLFYDILFIDTQGDIFHTVMKEKDYNKNILQDELAKTSLARKIKNKPMEAFVDFQYYYISKEPSSFFVEPVADSTGIIGWYAFQVSINKLNNLVSAANYLGTTGEVLLVNKSQFMLNNSRFDVKPTMLKQKIPDENFVFKFNKKEGNSIVVDYRGRRALTSFKVFSFLGTDWLIIAKMDESEIVSEIYRQNPKAYQKIITQPVSLESAVPTDSMYFTKNIINVDMDEFQRTDSADILYTKSVFTCTALLIKYPGRFSYLAHLSPVDKVYGGKGTDIVTQMMKQISEKEILKSESGNLEYVVVSPRGNALSKIVDLLLGNGVFLSQIKILLNPKALYADVSCDFERNNVQIYWKINKHDTTFLTQSAEDVQTLGEKVKSNLPALQ